MPDEFIRRWGIRPCTSERCPSRRSTICFGARSPGCASGCGSPRGPASRPRRSGSCAGCPSTACGPRIRSKSWPEIEAASSERAVFLEGCLSFNSVVVAVERAVSVRIRGAGLDGRVTVREYGGFGASVVQHELDHLDGILTLDRATLHERRRATALLIAEATVRAA